MSSPAIVRFSQQAPSWDETLTAYLAWKRACGASEATLECIKRCAKSFHKDHGTAWPDGLRLAVVSFFGEPRRPATHTLLRAHLGQFLRWCVAEGFIADDPTRGIRSRKAEPRVVKATLEDVKSMLDAWSDDTRYTHLRDRSILLVQLDTGARPKEVLSLRADDIDLTSGAVTIRAETCKTRKRRVVFISQPTIRALRRLLVVLPVEWRDGPIFRMETGKPMTTRRWCERMRKFSVAPYDLRHLHAIESIRAGVGVETLRAELGHESILMTQRYLRIVESDVRAAHEKAGLVAKVIPEPQKRVRKVK